MFVRRAAPGHRRASIRLDARLVRLFARLRVLSPETRTGVFHWRKARVSKRSYVVKSALRGTDRETELAVDRRRDQPSLKRPLPRGGYEVSLAISLTATVG